MARFRLPRSFRTYLIIGFVVTVTILTFSTSRIGRIGANQPIPSFQSLTVDHNKQPSASSLENITNQATLLFNHTSFHHNNPKSPNADFHTTSADFLSSKGSSYGSGSTTTTTTTSGDSSVSPIIQANLGPFESSSDIIVISPSSATISTLQSDSKSSTTTGGSSPDGSSIFPTTSRHEEAIPINSFNSSSQSLGRSMREFNAQSIEEVKFRKNFVRDMMKHAWRGYADYAWGFNEVRPVSKTPHTESIFGGEKLGASIVDGIDTLYIMGLREEYLAARTWIENNLDFNTYESDLSVFETNIRFVGGLLSTYALTNDRMFLNKAVLIADKLLPAFDSPSGIPYSNVNLGSATARNHDWAYGSSILSEFGSMHLEFIYLSHVTGDPKYRDKVLKIRDTIKRAVPRQDGLYNNYMNTETGQWLARPTHVSMGALGDSFYEYLIKAYVQSDRRDIEAFRMYIDAIKAYENKLIFTSTQSRLVYFAELKDTSINHKMDSLACFSGGMLALGANHSDESSRGRYMNLASGIANTCHEACIRTKSHLSPEAFVFSSRADAMAFGPSEKYYILRPEILETYFYMWRYTHDPKYRAWAWDFVEALERYCKAEAGYSGLRNVYQPVIKDDVQQSFFLAEVLKYLYLIFSDDNVISLDDWVFNTEAHPFPILKHAR